MIDQFIDITRTMIERDGLDEYLPTLLLPEQNKVLVLDDIPVDVDDERVATEWAREKVEPGEDYFLAFRSGETHFKVVARLAGRQYEQVCDVPAA